VKNTVFNLEQLTNSLQLGEQAIEHAPALLLRNGNQCIPQHYLYYRHTRESVEQLVLDIQYSERFPIFVDEDIGGIYIQIGVIGHDNYDKNIAKRKHKLIYGRKWRVEVSLPTSEVIQTVFLAIKKAREHEVRELFRFEHQGCVSTPFNNHHDLPLMANNHGLISTEFGDKSVRDKSKNIVRFLNKVTYDSAKLSLKHIEQRANKQWIIDINIQPKQTSHLPEIGQAEITVILPFLSINCLCFQLMDHFLSLSDKNVNENFFYKNFARFSQNNDILAIADLSIQTRKKVSAKNDGEFFETFNQVNYQTDRTRVPKLYQGTLSERINLALAKFEPLDGILPNTGELG